MVSVDVKHHVYLRGPRTLGLEKDPCPSEVTRIFRKRLMKYYNQIIILLSRHRLVEAAEEIGHVMGAGQEARVSRTAQRDVSPRSGAHSFCFLTPLTPS